MSSELAATLRRVFHTDDLPIDSPIRLASDALDAARSQVDAAHKRAADADALLREARARIRSYPVNTYESHLIDRIDAFLAGEK